MSDSSKVPKCRKEKGFGGPLQSLLYHEGRRKGRRTRCPGHHSRRKGRITSTMDEGREPDGCPTLGGRADPSGHDRFNCTSLSTELTPPQIFISSLLFIERPPFPLVKNCVHRYRYNHRRVFVRVGRTGHYF